MLQVRNDGQFSIDSPKSAEISTKASLCVEAASSAKLQLSFLGTKRRSEESAQKNEYLNFLNIIKIWALKSQMSLIYAYADWLRLYVTRMRKLWVHAPKHVGFIRCVEQLRSQT